MTRLTWDSQDYETGIDRGVFFSTKGGTEAWSGLVSVQETTNELYNQTSYQDGIKYVNRRSVDSFSATIEAYTYPDALLQRGEFGCSYRVRVGEGYNTHLVYNAIARMKDRVYAQSDTEPFGFDISTRPSPIYGAKPSAHLIVDSNKAYPSAVAEFENILYGSDDYEAHLPSPEELLNIFEVNSILRIIDNGDGTWTAIGPDDVIQMLDPMTFQINWPSAVMIDAVSYKISSF